MFALLGRFDPALWLKAFRVWEDVGVHVNKVGAHADWRLIIIMSACSTDVSDEVIDHILLEELPDPCTSRVLWVQLELTGRRHPGRLEVPH